MDIHFDCFLFDPQILNSRDSGVPRLISVLVCADWFGELGVGLSVEALYPPGPGLGTEVELTYRFALQDVEIAPSWSSTFREAGFSEDEV